MYANGRLPASALAPIAGGRLRKDAALRWNAMNAARRRRGQSTILPNGSYSSYRDYAGQLLMRKMWCARGNCGNAAIPGTSNHGMGIAVDANNPAGVNASGAPFGFQKRWSDAPWEPWHFKWAGFGSTAGGAASSLPTLKYRSQGPSVVKLKKALFSNGIRNFSATKDGKPNNNRYNDFFGEFTRDAVKRFQRAHGLSADGVVGPTTWRKLGVTK